MKHAKLWKPTKFVSTSRGLRASRDKKWVSTGSRFITDLNATSYEKAVKAHARGKLLDMGCGHVPLFGVYRDLVDENICIDWENSLHKNPHLDFAVDLGGALPFPDGEFDTILLTDVLEHLPNPLEAMREASRVLKCGGKIIVGVPFMYWLHEEPHDFYRYTEFALRRFCEQSGLKVSGIEAFGGAPDILLDITSKCLDIRPRAGAIFRPVHSILVGLNSTGIGRKLSRATSESFPLGYTMVAEKI